MNTLYRLAKLRLAQGSIDLFDIGIAAGTQLFDGRIGDVLEQ